MVYFYILWYVLSLRIIKFSILKKKSKNKCIIDNKKLTCSMELELAYVAIYKQIFKWNFHNVAISISALDNHFRLFHLFVIVAATWRFIESRRRQATCITRWPRSSPYRNVPFRREDYEHSHTKISCSIGLL